MKYLLIVVLLCIFFLLYCLSKEFSKKFIINLFFTIGLSIIILYIILNPKQCINFTISGAKLFFFSVFPSLFPFLVVMNLIFMFGGIEIYSKLLGYLICKPLGLPKECSIVLLASVFCGYPLGAKYACEIYDRNLIDKATFKRLLNIASNGSPLFIIGTVGTSMLQNSTFGYILLISNILSCFVMGIIIPRHNNKLEYNKNRPSLGNDIPMDMNIGIALKTALEEAVKTCISIGSFVVIFSVLINIIKSSGFYSTTLNHICNAISISPNILDASILGTIEITNGCNIISKAPILPTGKLLICSFLIGFGGLSIASQVYSFIYKYKVSMKKYLFLKLIQGSINCIITYIIIKIPLSINYQETFANTSISKSYTPTLFIFLIIVIVLPVIVKNLKKLFSFS